MSRSNNQSMQKRRNRRSTRTNNTFGGTTPNQLYSIAFPREMKVTMKYVESLSRTPSAGLATDYVFHLNSIFDPDSTGTGHQPQGHDQWAAFYNRYRVDAVKATIRLVGNSSGYLTMLANNSTAAVTSIYIGAESPLSTTLSYSVGGAAVQKTVIYNLANINGVTRAVYNADDRYQSPFGSSPTETLNLHTIWQDGAGGTGVGVYQVELDYMVTLFDPIQQSIS